MVPLSTTVHLSLATRLPDHAGKCRSPFAIEISFEPVADGFVQQDAGPAGAEHHFHLASRRFTRVQLNNRLPRRFLGEMLRSLLAEEEVKRYAAAAAGAAAGGIAARSWRCSATFKRASGWESSAKVPSEPITRILRISSE